MMRTYADIAEQDKVYNADRSRAASIHQRDRDDIFDSDSTYEIELWDTRDGTLVDLYTRTHKSGAGGSFGKPVVGVEFDPTGALFVCFDDGSREPAEPPPLVPPRRR